MVGCRRYSRKENEATEEEEAVIGRARVADGVSDEERR